MEPTTEDALPFKFETTQEDLRFINQTEKPQTFHPPALPPGWTNEQFHKLLILYEIRMVLCGIGLLANSLILLLQLKLKTFKKPQLIFAFTLTATDGIVCPAVFMQTYYYRNNVLSVPLLYHVITFATTIMSLLLITAVACDRYLALCAIPLKYKLWVNSRRYTFVIIVMCALSTGYGWLFGWFFTFENDFSTGLRTFIVSIILIGTTTIIYIFVYFSVSRSLKKLSLPTAIKNARIRQTRRLMFAFALILGTNVICSMPQPLFGLYIAFQPIGQGYLLFKNNVISNLLYNVQCLNFTLNPVIYWWQVLLRDLSLPCRRNNTRLKANSSSPIQEVATVTSQD
ncbi:hypothetical protein HOLleu_10092 [Holothuria leucospilota]|uniref:G-protein coupled receptors family 1 profile domain-containing protein n=1 Tax=Holothuria leucospilota TaxID=206669 RepID=A0A9Q1CEN2_HOLLE|nr:hypothetical protein HOLleu_10092 [Holothuria leucospilota]